MLLKVLIYTKFFKMDSINVNCIPLMLWIIVIFSIESQKVFFVWYNLSQAPEARIEIAKQETYVCVLKFNINIYKIYKKW